MQRLLTEEEYQALVNQGQAERDRLKDVIQDLCTKVAKHMPTYVSWEKELIPWGCTLDSNSGTGYCDQCPVQEHCPSDRKEWSK